jgi:DNA-binding response OmpR family regulator
MGVGSTFCFAIPIAKGSIALSAHPAAPAPILSTEPEQEQPLSLANQKQEGATASELPGRVLVVDDEPVNLQVVANHLSLQGMTVQTACCGPDALQIIDGANAPDLVLLDVMMPQMNGFEVCRAIRNRKNLSELPVVLLTALSRKEDVVCGFAAGANDYLTKPFHGEELVARVRSQLSVRNALAATKDNLRLAAEVNEGKLAEARARLDAERASLETLRYQLNPHFLMNALAAIRGAIGEAPDTARHAISDLSEFCRLTLRRAPVETLTVEEELEMIRLFLRIHKTRWGDYLKVSTEIDTSMLRAKIPAWLLQPIVENALKHGMRTSPRSLEIRMVGHRRDKNALVFRVSNTGHYVALDESQGESTGIGMENLRKRLEKWYPEGHSLTLTDESGWVHVELTLVENALTTETQTLGADALSISQESN